MHSRDACAVSERSETTVAAVLDAALNDVVARSHQRFLGGRAVEHVELRGRAFGKLVSVMFGGGDRGRLPYQPHDFIVIDVVKIPLAQYAAQLRGRRRVVQRE